MAFFHKLNPAETWQSDGIVVKSYVHEQCCFLNTSSLISEDVVMFFSLQRIKWGWCVWNLTLFLFSRANPEIKKFHYFNVTLSDTNSKLIYLIWIFSLCIQNTWHISPHIGHTWCTSDEAIIWWNMSCNLNTKWKYSDRQTRK